MKKLLLFVVSLTSIVSTNAQTIDGDHLDINNIKARINADGSLFCDYGTTYNQGFEVPKGSGKHTIFAGNLWFGGIDASAVLKMAGQTYKQTGTDFFPGPLTATATTDSITMAAYNRVWKINQCDIDIYVNWFNGGQIGINPTDSIAMNTILNWPAYSPTGLALAPFVDANTNSVYDPYAGDYPLIKGDQAVFFVYNDKGGPHTETGGNAIGLEIQGMAYAYRCPDDSALYNTIFTNYKIINRSLLVLDSAFLGSWTDFDIGNFADDFVGCDVTRSAYYGYNGNSTDSAISAGQYTYGANPPAQAVVFLKGPRAYDNGIDDSASSVPNGTGYGDGIIDNERAGMGKFLYYNNNFTTTGNPVVAGDFYDYIAGSWLDGTLWTYGGTGHLTGVPCDYMFPGTTDPLGYGTNMVPQAPWDELTSGNIPADRRGLASAGPFRLQPGASEIIDLAYVFGRATSGGNLASVTVMQERIDSIHQKFSNGITACGCPSLTGIADYNNNNNFLAIYPNPATTNITINFTSTSKNASIKIYDVRGRLVKSIANVKSGETTFNISELESGLYLVNVNDGNISTTKRFIKQ